MIKVAFLNPTIPPRVVSLLNRISKNEEVVLKAFFFAVSQKNRSWSLKSKEYERISFPFEILNSVTFGFGIKDYHNSFLSFDIWQKLSDYDPDIVLLPGWADVTSYLAFMWAKYNHKKIILRSESTVYEKSIRRIIFSPISNILCKNVDLIIGSSYRASEYSKLLAPNTKAITIWSSFDTLKFNQQVNKVKENKNKIKDELGILQKRVFYFNGQTIERKGLLLLLAVFLKKKYEDYALVITGKGKLDDRINAIAQKNNNIYHFGYQTQNKLPTFYAVSDFFILPSFEETWGLVTVEALAAGLPVIVSDMAGSSELIVEGDQGFIISSLSIFGIESKVQEALALSKKDYNRMKSAGESLALSTLSYESIANQFVNEFKQLFVDNK